MMKIFLTLFNLDKMRKFQRHLFCIFLALFLLGINIQNSNAQQCRITSVNNGSSPGILDCNNTKVWCMQQGKQWCFNNKHDYTQVPNPNIFTQTCEVGYLMMLGQFQLSGYQLFDPTTVQDAIWSFTNSKAFSGAAANLRQSAIAHCNGTATTAVVISKDCEKTKIQVTTNEAFLVLTGTNIIVSSNVSFNPGNGVLLTNGATSFTIEGDSKDVLSVQILGNTAPITITYWQDLDLTDPDVSGCQILGSVPMGGVPYGDLQYVIYESAFNCPTCPGISITPTEICNNGVSSVNYTFATTVGTLSDYNYTFTWNPYNNPNSSNQISTPVNATIPAIGSSYQTFLPEDFAGTFEVKLDKSCRTTFSK
jgi:hypothetical protein